MNSAPLVAGRTRALLVDFDGDSSRKAASGNNHFWQNNCGVPVELVVQREWGYYAPAAIGLTVRGLAERGLTPLLLGGGHSLTYHAVAELCHCYGALNILHFDAHHDRYRVARLSHYSVMSRLQADLPVAVTSLGVRFEVEHAVPLARPPYAGAPWYITIDVDYFSPALVGSVMHPVELSGPPVGVPEVVAHIRDRVGDAGIVGADIVEWIEPRATDKERAFVSSLIDALTAELGSHPCN